MTEPATLTDAAFTLPSLHRAWDHVRIRAAGPGIDRVTVVEFAAGAGEALRVLHEELHHETWQPRPAVQLRIANDPERPIALSTVRDRIVHRALSLALAESWESRAAEHTWAFRRGRSVRGALLSASEAIRRGRRAWGRTDFRQFFDRIPQEALLQHLDEHWGDPRLRKIISRCLRAGALRGPATTLDDLGLPQGCALSPVLSNIYLHPFDQACADLPSTVLRYADDLLVLAHEPDEVSAALEAMQDAATTLELSLNARKTQHGTEPDGLVFLGGRFDTQGGFTHQTGLVALEERVDREARETFDDTRQTLEAWEEWHGPLDPSLSCHPALIGVLLTRWLDTPCTPSETARALRALTRQRARTIHEEPSHDARRARALVPLWCRALEWVADAHHADPGADDRPAREALLALRSELERALVREARLAVSDAARPWGTELGALLGLPPTFDPRHDWGPEQWKAAFLAAGQGARAAALLHLSRTPAPPAAREIPRVERSPEERSRILEERFGDLSLLVAREDARGHRQFSRETDWETDGVNDHLQGKTQLGVSLTPRRRMARVLVFSLKPPRPPDPGQVAPDTTERMLAAIEHETSRLASLARDSATRLWTTLHDLDLHPLLESCEDGRWRIWLFLDAPLATQRAEQCLATLARAMPPLHEGFQLRWFPRSQAGRRTTGHVETLPLGRCPRRDRWSVLHDRWGEPVVAPWKLLEDLPRTSTAYLEQCTGSLRRASATPPLAARENPLDRLQKDLEQHPRCSRMVDGCGILRSILERAAITGTLEPLEIASLLETIGHLTDQEASRALERILSEVRPTTPDQIRQRLKRLPAYPLSCPKLRRRHPRHIAPCEGCAERGSRLARTEDKDGSAPDVWTTAAYPSPLLHANGVDGFSFLTWDGRYITPRTQQVRARSGQPPLRASARPTDHALPRGTDASPGAPHMRPEPDRIRETEVPGVPDTVDLVGKVALQPRQSDKTRETEVRDAPSSASPPVPAHQSPLSDLPGVLLLDAPKETPRTTHQPEDTLGAPRHPPAPHKGEPSLDPPPGEQRRRLPPPPEAAFPTSTRMPPPDATTRNPPTTRAPQTPPVTPPPATTFLTSTRVPPPDATTRNPSSAQPRQTPPATLGPRAEPATHAPTAHAIPPYTELDTLLDQHLQARQEMERTRAALIAHFEHRSAERLRTSSGTLIYHPGSPPGFTLEFD